MSQIKCPACFSQNFILLGKLDIALQNSLYAPKDKNIQNQLTIFATQRARVTEYEILKCGSCGLEYANPMISPGQDWYMLAYNSLDLYPSERWEFSYMISKLKKGDTVLEIGCGSGSFLEKCKELNIKAYGLDLSSCAVEVCVKKRLEASIIDPELKDIPKEVRELKPTLFCSFHTLEHLEKPGRLFELAYDCSTENSGLWISIPSHKRPTRFFGETDFLDSPPHHLTRWTPKSLEIIGRNNGWNLHEVIYEPISLNNRLWYYTTRMNIYKKLSTIFGSSKNLERIFRYALYPVSYLSDLRNRKCISGFSMLAKFIKL